MNRKIVVYFIMVLALCIITTGCEAAEAVPVEVESSSNTQPSITRESLSGAVFDDGHLGGDLDLLGGLLSDWYGGEVSLEAVSNADIILAMLQADELDFALFSFADYVPEQDGVPLVPLLLPAYEGGSPYYRGAFIVRSGFGAYSLEDLEGVPMAYAYQEGYYNCWMPRAMLASLGYDPNTFFSDVLPGGNSPAELYTALLDGDVDVGITWADEETDGRSSVDGEFPDIWDTTEVVAYTPWIPNFVLFAREDLMEEDRAALRTAFLDLIMDDNGQDALFDVAGIIGLEEPDHRYWEAIELLGDYWYIELDYDLGGWPD